MEQCQAFSTFFDGTSRQLYNDVCISSNGNSVTVKALWDTGATMSAISHSVGQQTGHVQHGTPCLSVIKISSAHGEQGLFKVGAHVASVPYSLDMPPGKGLITVMIIRRDVTAGGILDDPRPCEADI